MDFKKKDNYETFTLEIINLSHDCVRTSGESQSYGVQWSWNDYKDNSWEE